MESLKDIKRRMDSIGDIHKVTRAMKMVSVAKLRKAEKKLKTAKERSEELNYILNNKKSAVEKIDLPSIVKESKQEKISYILISSNKGLCGAFNKNIFKKFNTVYTEGQKNSYYVVGKKIIRFLRRENHFYEKKFLFPDSSYFYKFARNLISTVLCKFYNKETDTVKVIYNKNVSSFLQQAQSEKILPLETPEDSSQEEKLKYICEPTNFKLIKNLAVEAIISRLFYILEMSEVAEHTARMNAMDAASDNALELLDELKLEYNKARQASITKEIIEIASTAEALKE